MTGRRNLKMCLTICSFLLPLVSTAKGATLYVNTDGSGGAYTSIQAAIDAADDRDEIRVSPGTYQEAINFKRKAVKLYSTGGPDQTTINGTGHYNVVQCVSGEGPGTILEGFTIIGGRANDGGGMLNINGSSPTVTNCTFRGNSAIHNGGGMYNEDSSPTVTYCTFTGNSADTGGGMYNEYSSPTVTYCIFSDNDAEYGGGMGNNTSSPTVTGCTFGGNTAGYGGGMSNQWGSPNVMNCIFSGNSAGNSGGGVYSDDSSPTMTNCTFNGNSAD